MKIERIQVEEGFLDGLDLDLSDGLNVLIGPRGAGKTSVIELLRYCLASQGFSDRSRVQAKEHALSVLGSGQVTVTLSSPEGRTTVTRSANDSNPRASARYQAPLIFSQNEIESIGLEADSRLGLIDFFRTEREKSRERAALARAEVRSLIAEMRALAQEIADIEERAASSREYRNHLELAEHEHQQVVHSIGDSEGRWEELDELTSTAAELAVRDGVYERVMHDLGSWVGKAKMLVRSGPEIEEWPKAAGGSDPLSEMRALLSSSLYGLSELINTLDTGVEDIIRMREENRVAQVQIEERSRGLRRDLEQLQKGGSAITKRISALREQIAQLEALAPILERKREAWTNLRNRRNVLLDELDALCEGEYAERAEIADRLNQQLGPTIRVTVERFGIQTEYVHAIRNALRGTGLHYNTLAPVLAERMSPREVLEAVETQDFQTISTVAGIPPDRAARLVAEFAKGGVEELVTCELRDSVILSLLDGGEYKSTENLSTGQRCTVILPLLLAKEDRIVVIDQPEDHLDNGFIVGTAIEAIRKRKQLGQLLFSTHNPNIPVLGEASQVILMGSDGQNGFVRHSGSLDHPESVVAITTVMEGGLAAFHRRAEFYGDKVDLE
jgi:prefoldin subunit 5